MSIVYIPAMGNLNIHPLLKEISNVFTGAGREVYLVGGAVRDLLLGREAVDWDLASDAKPEEVQRLFKRVIPTGIRHGTVTVRYRGVSLEVTTFRTETSYSDGRRPDKVRYAAAIEEDLSRRDFTMNAAAVKLPEGMLVDPFDGRADIAKKLIRSVGKAEERFNEDGLRPLRAVRFAAQLGFDLEEATLRAIPGALATTEKVAAERIRDELDKILASANPRRGFLFMEETGLLRLVLPELAACRNVEQKGYHRFDVLDHLLFSCEYAAQKQFSREVIMAALLHDIGKPAVSRFNGETGAWTFYSHEKESLRLAGTILKRFRYPNAVTGRVLRLIGEHMFNYTAEWTDAAVRRFIRRAGEDLIPELLQLRLADSSGTSGVPADPVLLAPFRRHIGAVLEHNRAVSLKDLLINGNDLMAMGVRPGKYVGIILNELLEAVTDDPELNTREKLLEIAGKINRRYL